MKLLIASGNKKKLKEIEEIFAGLPIEYLTIKDFPPMEEPEETGTSFIENALIKARGYARSSGVMTLAEDSGLCVRALGGRPGVFSARYAGPAKNDEANLDLVLHEMRNTPEGNRMAWYESAVAVVLPDGRELTSLGRVEGELLRERHGTGGFGYDPIFYYPPFKATFGQAPQEMKNKVSHRFHALEAMRGKLEKILKPGVDKQNPIR